MTILEHPLWGELLPYLYIRRGATGVNGARHRIEVRQDAPASVFRLKVDCAHCGRSIFPIRRDARGAWTFNVSCPLAVRVKCARMPASTAMAKAVRGSMAAYHGTPPAPEREPTLFPLF